MVMSAGKVITVHTQITAPNYLSVANSTIYLSDQTTGVYQSTDDGVNWSLLFKSTNRWHCLQVIKVTTDLNDDFWTLETTYKLWHLRVYSVDRRQSNDYVTWRDVNVLTTDGQHIALQSSSLSYDGNVSIFVSDNDNNSVHVFSVNGQYHSQLLSSYHIKDKPVRLAADSGRQLLYVGQKESVEVFKLTYGTEGH